MLSQRDADALSGTSVPLSMTSSCQQRILQLDGKRYSLRLEREFWSALEAIAVRRKLRLNRLVAEVAAGCPAGGNLASTLRVFCLGEIERAAEALAGYRRRWPRGRDHASTA